MAGYGDEERRRGQGYSGGGDIVGSAKIIAGAATSAYRHEVDKIDKAEIAGAAANILRAAGQYGHLEGKPLGQYIEKAGGFLDSVAGSKRSDSYDQDDDDAPRRPHGKPAQGKPARYEYDDDVDDEKSGAASGGPGRYSSNTRPEMPRPQHGKPARYEDVDDVECSGGGHAGRYSNNARPEMPRPQHGKPARYEDDNDVEYSGGGSGGYGKPEHRRPERHGDDSGSSGGIGDYMKLAQGFMGGGHGSSSGSGSGGGGIMKIAEGFIGSGHGHDGGGGAGVSDYMKLAEGFLRKN